MLKIRLLLALLTAGVLAPAAFAGPKDEDRIYELVEGRGGEQLMKITHITRHHAKGKGGPSPACTCPGTDGTGYSLEKVKWLNSIDYTIYTSSSGLGAAVGPVVYNSFVAWRNAEPAAPAVNFLQDDVNGVPGAALDGQQVIGWAPISSIYGSNTLAVTVYWASRVKIGGFSKVVHFDMLFNTDYNWSIAGSPESCGGAGAFDVANVATHEAGHVFGIGHNNACNLTMNPTAPEGETTKASLAIGDQNAIKAVY